MMSGEREWVESLAELLRKSPGWSRLDIAPHQHLLYALEIKGYGRGEDEHPDYKAPRMADDEHRKYQTDLLVSEPGRGKSKSLLIPRVVVEFKLGSVSTHDALTYSAKAATHKQVHPHVRYGIVIVGHESGRLPRRLIWHGHAFDFMLSLKQRRPNKACIAQITRLLKREVKASRQLSKLFEGELFYQLHRKLELSAKA